MIRRIGMCYIIIQLVLIPPDPKNVSKDFDQPILYKEVGWIVRRNEESVGP